MRRLQIPDIAFASRDVTLNGRNYTLTFRYNERDARWRMDIYDQQEVLLKAGISIVEDFNLTETYSILDQMEGFLFTVKLKGGDIRTGRDNIGVDKTHELLYTTFEELL